VNAWGVLFCLVLLAATVADPLLMLCTLGATAVLVPLAIWLTEKILGKSNPR
jgi:hypothetical protein